MSIDTTVRSIVTWPTLFRSRALLSLLLSALGAALLVATFWARGDDWQLLGTAAVWSLTIAFAVSCRRLQPPGTRGFTALDPFLGLGVLFGVALPAHNVLVGPPVQVRGVISSDQQALQALAVSYAFFVMVVLGWAFVRSRTVDEMAVQWAPRGLVAVLLVLGALGALLRYRSSSYLEQMVVVGGAGIGDLLGTLLAPLLPVGAFLAIFRPGSSAAARLVGALLLVPPSIYASSTYALNRAIFVVPAVAMFVVLVRTGRVRRVVSGALALAILGTVVFVALGQLRLDALRQEHGAYVEQVSSVELAKTSLQVYGQSPYLTGIVLELSNTVPYRLSTPVYSILSPVPRIGEAFRAENGTRLYNTAIGRGNANDQIIPVWLEVYLSGGLGMLGFAGIAMGIVLKWLDNVLRSGKRLLSVYAACFASLWVAQSLIVSLMILAQIFIYFVLPLALLSLFEGRQALKSEGREPSGLRS